MSRSNRHAPATPDAAVDDWRNQANCLQYDPELWWPIGTSGPAVQQMETAISICLSCPVRLECLRFAVDNHIPEGVWGGMGEDERSSYKRRTSRQRRETERRMPRASENQAVPRPTRAALVPPEDTRYMIGVYRTAGVPWKEIGRRLGTSDSTCKEVVAGTRTRISAAIEETARAMSGLVNAG
jgi:WhiB family redox-sensing transcriptional regulator